MSFPKFGDLSRVSGTFLLGKPGPKTPQGKAIAARNATSHGLFARDIVLPQLGEDPAAYNTLHLALCEQIDPRNLIETHYVEGIAAASWRLRRLHRWQAQVYEDETLTEDERLDKLDRVLRHETALHRQIDKAVRLLGRDVPLLFEGRARRQALADLEQTERTCRTDLEADLDVAFRANDYLKFCPVQNLDYKRLDNIHSVPSALVNDEAPAPAQPQVTPQVQNCQNELVPAHSSAENCQNELPAVEDTVPPEKQPVKTQRTCGRKALTPARSRTMALRLPKKKPKQTSQAEERQDEKKSKGPVPKLRGPDKHLTRPRSSSTLSLLKERVGTQFRGEVPG